MAVSSMYQHFGGMYCLCIEFRPENRWGRSFKNVGSCLPRYEASDPWRLLQLSWIVFDCCVCISLVSIAL